MTTLKERRMSKRVVDGLIETHVIQQDMGSEWLYETDFNDAFIP